MADFYKKGQDPAVDGCFADSEIFEKVYIGGTYLFWKQALKWYMLDLKDVVRCCTKEEISNGYACVCCSNYRISTLICEMKSGEKEEIMIGTELKNSEPERLLNAVRKACPSVELGCSEEDRLWNL